MLSSKLVSATNTSQSNISNPILLDSNGQDLDVKSQFSGSEFLFCVLLSFLRMCEHPNIINFIGAYVPDTSEINGHNWKDDSTQIKPFIVLEYHPDTLSEVIENLTIRINFKLTN